MQLNRFMLMLALPLAAGFAVGMTGCADPDDPSCTVGSFGCTCYPGNICLAGLTCLSGICVQFSGEGETGDGDGDTGPGDGDGDTGPGDGDGDTGPGDGDGEPGDGDGDTGPGDGDGDPNDPCDGPLVTLYTQGDPDMAGYGMFANAATDFNLDGVEVADDFVIPQSDGCWCITEITARGFWSPAMIPGNPPDYIFEIYNDGNMLPTGAPIASGQGPADVSLGDYTATLEMEAVVPAGTHWLSFRSANDSAEPTWFWACTDTIPGEMAVVRDVQSFIYLDGLCTEWTPAEICFDGLMPTDPYELSVQFDIIGVVGGDACN